MSIVGSLKVISSRLKQARESAGLSTRTAAGRLQSLGHAITYATISNYENCKTVPPLAILDAFAAIYDRKREWFYAEGPTLSGIRYRAIQAVRVGEKRTFEGEALGWLTAYLAVEKVIDDPRKWPEDFKVEPNDSGPAVAEKLRKASKLVDLPIPSIVRLAENIGIRVIQVATEARIDGFAAMLDGVAVMAVNANLSGDRMRMNVAHEIAHHLFADCVKSTTLSEKEIERRAMDCGSHLLIPDQAIEDAIKLKSMVRLVQYKERFGVSLAAMIFRGKALGLLTEQEYQRLWIEFGRLGWRKDEPGYVPPDRPMRMESLFDAAVNQNKMTYTQIATLAGLDERVVRQRVMSAVGGMSEAVDGRRELNPMRIDNYRPNSGSKEM